MFKHVIAFSCVLIIFIAFALGTQPVETVAYTKLLQTSFRNIAISLNEIIDASGSIVNTYSTSIRDKINKTVYEVTLQYDEEIESIRNSILMKRKELPSKPSCDHLFEKSLHENGEMSVCLEDCRIKYDAILSEDYEDKLGIKKPFLTNADDHKTQFNQCADDCKDMESCIGSFKCMAVVMVTAFWDVPGPIRDTWTNANRLLNDEHLLDDCRSTISKCLANKSSYMDYKRDIEVNLLEAEKCSRSAK